MLVGINIILIGLTLLNRHKSSSAKSSFTFPSLQVSRVEKSDFYNTACPDIEMFDRKNQGIALSDFIGEVVVIRFTRFHAKDIPYLLYLEHLYNKYKESVIHLFFINMLGRTYSESIDDTRTFSVPVIEDDGYISGPFNARLNDFVIIGKDFRIKFKHNQVSNRIICNQIMRYLFDDFFLTEHLPDKEVGSLVKKINYKDIKSGEIENLGESTQGKSSPVTLFVSQCFGCPEHQRIRMMKELSTQIGKGRAMIILLFGRGNDFKSIKTFSEKNDLLDSITVGMIQDSGDLTDEEYYQIFKLNVNPCPFLFNRKGEICFSEGVKDQRRIDVDFLKKRIS